MTRLLPLARLLRGHRRIIAVAIVSGVANHVFTIASAVLGALLVGRALTGTPAADLRGGFLLLLALVVPLVVAPWAETQLAHVVAFRVLVDVRGRVYDSFARMSPGDLLSRRSGELGSTAISDVELLETFFAHTLSPLVSAAVVPAGALVALAFLDPTLALALLPVLAALASVPIWLRRRAEADGTAVRSAAGALNAEAVDALQGLREVLAFGAGRAQARRLRDSGRALDAARTAHSRRAGVELAATDAIVTLGVLAALVVGGSLVAAGDLPADLLPAAVVLAAFSLAPVTAVVDVAREVGIVSAAAVRVLDLLAVPRAVPDPERPADVRDVRPRVEYRAVTFRYAPDLPPAVQDLDFTIEPGETVALVGHSGAGKSTSAHLLLRLWDVGGGAITIGGHDLRTIADADLRRLVAYVPQDVHLFNISIADNLRLGRPDATRDQIEAAARTAQAHEFVTDLPDGYDTVAGELGNLLSGGQRQRLSIARALLAGTPILVLDEAVSNLDTESERQLAAAIAATRSGHTTLVIAHRLTTIRTADRVVMLEHGRVVEQGRPDDLLARDGRFAELVRTQLTPDPA
ncbi:ABC transporter ATP-binding protein [Phytohabitans sp. ZYX-F-186]|uniref:ABC transporter ATP-binding protein n=1 Tax=Phytohabitans maris TaxID=3071409 RepID=A0ABU0ZLY6_9ACTN|nr:ABC transporter ATP-binding protein [Phytohabitans sp. ZYX-F-186]MDQ7908056.1 ABC transporter ATP-binding protein [Phytohabitans sp. ZYX-F-186]